MSQIQACQLRISELRGSLAILAERCASLEQLHEGTVERLRSFSSTKAAPAPTYGTNKDHDAVTAVHLKKQSTAKLRCFQNRHSDLMKCLQQIFTEGQAESWVGLKKTSPTHDASHSASPRRTSPDAEEVLAKSPAVSLEKHVACETGSANVQVMLLDGPAAKLRSRLRFHDIQEHSPRRNLLGNCGPCPSTESRVIGSTYPARTFPGAEPFQASRTRSGEAAQAVDKNGRSRVDEIRRRAAEIETRRASMCPEHDSIGVSLRSRSPISDVWATCSENATTPPLSPVTGLEVQTMNSLASCLTIRNRSWSH
ncbi:unnamed protein product [Durusdinium trenchii]|uniref:Uncharacterized protein n=1 Tax=Durusdinium trenchii TaxID=1381693 RepID=A0ABP0JFG4_9DINO